MIKLQQSTHYPLSEAWLNETTMQVVIVELNYPEDGQQEMIRGVKIIPFADWTPDKEEPITEAALEFMLKATKEHFFTFQSTPITES